MTCCTWGSMGESDQVRSQTSSVWTSKQWNYVYIVTTCPLPRERERWLCGYCTFKPPPNMFSRHMEPLQRWYATIYFCMPPPRSSIEYGDMRTCGGLTRLVPISKALDMLSRIKHGNLQHLGSTLPGHQKVFRIEKQYRWNPLILWY